MGHLTVFGSSVDGSLSARVDLGVFSVLAGCPNAELARGAARSVIVVPVQRDWTPLIAQVLPSHIAYTRYPMQSPQPNERDRGFDRRRLAEFVEACPSDYAVVPIDEKIAQALTLSEWSSDLTGNFDSAADFVQRGLGFVAVERATGQAVAGASTFALCDAGIELEVDTAAPHQRRGLARVCAARLLLACLDQGWEVAWDAHVRHSAVLAEKLGYVYDTPYLAYTSDPADVDVVADTPQS